MQFLMDVITMIRHLIDDTGETPEYSDERLSALVFVSASYVNMELGSGYTINISCQSISPTPTQDFTTLVALKAACLFVRAEQTTYAKCDFKVSNGPTSVDMKGGAEFLGRAADSICAQYDKAKLSQAMGLGGYAITTPNSEV